MNTAVVPISLSHVPAFRGALDTVAKEKRYLAMVEAPPIEKMESFVGSNISKNIAQFVALDGDRVVGWADIIPAWAHGVSHRGSLGMGVIPGYRGQGIGRQLLEACINKSWVNGLTRIELEVRADNLAAIRLYKALGFVHEGVKPRGMRIDGMYYDTLQMGLLKHEA
ncbi:MAG: GNAT family N-acetyltransferase [Rubrivivax sp.]|nr:GNAT family N-acetyltransferase [Rubrivivax sp.]